MTPKSQVEKFNARYGKKEEDTRAIIEAQMRKEIASSSHDIPEEDKAKEELMKAGNIHEAAVVFSHAGMGAFARMFGNSMESAVERVLKERMDSIMDNISSRISPVIESKMLEMLEGMTQGMNSFLAEQEPAKYDYNLTNALKMLSEITTQDLEDETEDIISDLQDIPMQKVMFEPEDDKEPEVLLQEIPKEVRTELLNSVKSEAEEFEKWVNKPTEEPIDEPGVQSITFDKSLIDLKPLSKDTRFGTSKADLDVIEPYIMAIFKLNEGKEIGSPDILSILRDQYNIRMANFTIVLQKLMKKHPSIEKTAFGVYK